MTTCLQTETDQRLLDTSKHD